MSENREMVIVAENLAKQYRIGEFNTYDTLIELLQHKLGGSGVARASSGEPRTIWALRDVSFEVRQGEIVGIIGRNGAGKSTLLKILSRVTSPTRGRALIRGRVGSLLEVGTGFQPELTGRENVLLNGAILGMSRREILRKFDEIVAFAEVENFIDTPVKRYSSGMHSRLAFAVAAHLEPEILIVDEVLAVGDVAFQKKSLEKMRSFMQGGRTVLFVSHNMGSISELCDRAILLDRGTIARAGPVPEVVEAYLNLLNMDRGQHVLAALEDRDCSILSGDVLSLDGDPSRTFDLADSVVIELRYRLKRDLFGLQVTLFISRNLVELVRTFDTDDSEPMRLRKAGDYVCRHTIPRRFLKAGSYAVGIGLGTPERLMVYADNALSFEVEELSENTQHRGYRGSRPGQVISPGAWTTESIG
jgi:homopolymeric O-antigen transport system ATP-binding protein